jgi:hypothetical protein
VILAGWSQSLGGNKRARKKGESKEAKMMMFLPMTQVPFMTDAFVEFRFLVTRADIIFDESILDGT